MPQTLQELVGVVDKFGMNMKYAYHLLLQSLTPRFLGIGLVVSLTENPLPFTPAIPKDFYARATIIHLPVDGIASGNHFVPVD